MKINKLFFLYLFLPFMPFPILTTPSFAPTKDIIIRKDIPAAGILPYAFNELGTMYFLLGKETVYYKSSKTNKTKTEERWADFGGRKDNTDENSIVTAAREFTEETKSVFGKLLHAQKNIQTPIATTPSNEIVTIDDIKKQLALLESMIERYETQACSPHPRMEAQKTISLTGISLEDVAKRAPNKTDIQISETFITNRITASLLHPQNYYITYLANVETMVPSTLFEAAASVEHGEKSEYAWVEAKPFIKAMQKKQNRLFAQYIDGTGRSFLIRKQIYDLLHYNAAKLLQIIDQLERP